MKAGKKQKMGTGKILLIGGAALALYYILRKKSAIDNLKFDVVGVRPSLAGSSPTVNLDIRIRNVSSEAIDVNGISGQLILNNTIIGDVYTQLMQQIPAYSDTVAPVKVSLYNSGILNSVISFIDNISAPAADFLFRGTVDYKGARLPLYLNYKLV